MKRLTKIIIILFCTNIFSQQQAAAPTTSQIFIDFVGSGDVQQSVSNGTGYNANTGLGIIFERYNHLESTSSQQKNESLFQSLEIEAVFNVTSTADTIFSIINTENQQLLNRRNFGNYVLNPISAKQSLYVNSNIYFGFPDNNFGRYWSPIVSGINIRVIASNSTWQHKKNSYDLGVMAFRAGIFHEFLPDNYRLTEEGRSRYSLFLGANYTYRGIFGDIIGNDDIRNELLGTTDTSFSALELNFGFRLNNLRIEFQMPMFKDNEGKLLGMTGTQFLFTVKFIGGFGLKIDPNEI